MSQDARTAQWSSFAITRHEVKRIHNSVVVFIPGQDHQKCIIFNGHTDTVATGDIDKWKTDPLKLTEEEGRLYGLGTSDMKGGDAAILNLLLRYDKSPPPCDIYAMLVAEEETTGDGTRKCLEYLKASLKKYKTVSAVLGEPTSLGVVLGHRGCIFAKMTFVGQGGHASTPPTTDKQAIHKAKLFIDSITEKLAQWNHEYSDEILGSPGITVTQSQAGTESMNQVPTTATVTLDIRTIPTLHAKIEVEFKKWAREYGGKVELLHPSFAGFCPPSESIAQVAIGLAGQTEAQVTKGATDQQFFSKAGIPAIVCGPGNKASVHALNEYIEKSLLLACTGFYSDIMAGWARAAK